MELTSREAEVLALIAQGLTDRQVANHLSCSVSTINVHAKRILSKLQVSNRIDAVHRARHRGLLSPANPNGYDTGNTIGYRHGNGVGDADAVANS
ncbi:MAG: response regulator transcription factor [Anaerolineae bacterium]|nr:response regulator transcription factor [Anaerolineae bacterium]